MDMTPELEARLIEQEHRIVRVVQNFFDRKQWPQGDPRRDAARNAVLWRLLAPGTAAVAGSTAIALASLIFMARQTDLISEQNDYFKEQNKYLQRQIDLQTDQDTSRRRTEIIAALYETEVGPQNVLVPRANPRTRGEAVREFVQLERARLERLKSKPAGYLAELNLAQSRLDGLNLDNADLQGIVLVGAFLQNTSFSDGGLQKADLRAALMESTSFRGADLRGTNFEGSSLLQVSFARSDLRHANLGSASVTGCEFLGADLRSANLAGLKGWRDRANFRFANIAGAMGLDAQARAHMLGQGAVEIASDPEWQAFRKSFSTIR